jgi:uncharacterized membrane protein YbaN (DUF454 family)
LSKAFGQHSFAQGKMNLIRDLTDWLQQHPWVVWMLGGLSLAMLLATFVLVPWVIVRLPSDFFVRRQRSPTPWGKLHPGLRIALLIVKNVVGIVLILLGLVLALPLVPGPGIFVFLLGLALVNVPGKRRLERWIVSQPRVFAALNKLRQKHGQLPLERPQSAKIPTATSVE